MNENKMPKMNIQFFAGEKMITRTKAEALISPQISQEIFQGAIENSAILKHGRRLPNMTSKQTKLRVSDALPVAGFVTGDTGLKPTSDASWKNKIIEAEEIAVIIPIPEAVLDDADYDIIAQTKPKIVEAFGKVIDQAVLYGSNKPDTWPDGLTTQITTAGNNVAHVDSDTLYNQIDKAMAKVEENGYIADTILGGVSLKSGFRNMVDKNGQPIKGTEIDSINRDFVKNGAWDNSTTKMIVGDFSNLVYAIRQDITYKILDQATISDGDGKVIYNFAQQDMVGLRVVMRLGWQCPNPSNALAPTEATRFPFASVDLAASN